VLNAREKMGTAMKTSKFAAELLMQAIRTGMDYGENRGVVEFEPTDSANEKNQPHLQALSARRAIPACREKYVSLPDRQHIGAV
jgi:hypothetical protein